MEQTAFLLSIQPSLKWVWIFGNSGSNKGFTVIRNINRKTNIIIQKKVYFPLSVRFHKCNEYYSGKTCKVFLNPHKVLTNIMQYFQILSKCWIDKFTFLLTDQNLVISTQIFHFSLNELTKQSSDKTMLFFNACWLAHTNNTKPR